MPCPVSGIAGVTLPRRCTASSRWAPAVWTRCRTTGRSVAAHHLQPHLPRLPQGHLRHYAGYHLSGDAPDDRDPVDLRWDAEKLRRAEVVAAAAVYFEDACVPQQYSLATASLLPQMRPWVTNEYEHNGLPCAISCARFTGDRLSAGHKTLVARVRSDSRQALKGHSTVSAVRSYMIGLPTDAPEMAAYFVRLPRALRESRQGRTFNQGRSAGSL